MSDPQKFIEQREDTWLVFSDQIPLWVKIGMLKILYAAFEIEDTKKIQESRKKREERHRQIRASRGKDSQRLGDQPEQEEAGNQEEMTSKGMSQKRGADSAGEKCRVTFEARQAVSGYFGDDPSKITGHILDSILVLKGEYAMLDNIDDNHRFRETVVFCVGKEKKVHPKGKKTILMHNLVELRKAKPEIFKGLVIFQQPAAWMDEIIASWACQDLAERCPQCVHQRDLFSAALTDTSKKIMGILHQIPTWIAAKMTPVLQLTDTDLAFILKAAVRRFKEELAREMRNRARMKGEKESFKCGPEEMIRIAQAGHQHLVEVNAKEQIVLKGLRRNGMLQWRPDVVERCLKDCDLDDIFKDMPFGSHRMREDWMTNRKDWLQADGRPKAADWSRSDAAEKLEDLEEQDYCYKEKEFQKDYTVKIGEKDIKCPVIDIDCDEQALFSDKAVLESMHPKLRREIQTKFTGARTPAQLRARAAAKQVEKQRLKDCVAHMQEDWKEWVSESLIMTARKDLAKQLIPKVVGPKGDRKNKAKTMQKEVVAVKVKPGRQWSPSQEEFGGHGPGGGV